LTSVTLPNNIINIGDGAFGGCVSLASVSLPESVTSIGNGLFAGCTGLTNVMIPNSVTRIGNYAFYACPHLTDLTIPGGVTNIGDNAFAWCTGLTNVRFLSGVTSIGSYAFSYCQNLVSMVIPGSVTNIGDFAFNNCLSLQELFFNGNAPNCWILTWSSPVIVYYLPGTSGWQSLLGDVPTALWLPQMQTVDTNFGAQSNQFGFNINWAGGQTVVVEACTNLFNPDWLPVQTNTLITGSARFSDPHWTNYSNRFYRLRSP
jgi:hypothetical protein